MIRALLDTNVLASGFVAFADVDRAPARLLHLWREGRFALVVSDGIRTEFRLTVEDPCFRQRLTPEQIEEALRPLRDEATSVPPTVHVSGAATHAEADLVLAAAVSAEVHYLLTGDRRLQAVGSYAGVTILSPRTFLDLLGTTEGP